MPRIVRIPVDDDKPWLSVYFILSCLAYPRSIENAKQKRFLDALIFRREARGIPERLRDRFVREELKEIIDDGWEGFSRTMSAGWILTHQILGTGIDGPPTLANLEPYARELIGWDPDNVNTTYTTKIWKPSWPVIHLATTLWLSYYHQPNRTKWRIGRTLNSYPALVELLKIQDLLRITLPYLNKKYKDQLIKFEFAPAQEQIVDKGSRELQAIFATFNLLFESEPGAYVRAVKDETGTYKVELVPIELHPVPKTSS